MDDPSLGAHDKDVDDPSLWLGDTPLLDLADTTVSLRARSLTQLSRGEREKALALHGFVKQLPFAMPRKIDVLSPRTVLLARRGAAIDKLGLLVAMLRMLGIPARVRLMYMDLDYFKGFRRTYSHTGRAVRAVLDVWLEGRWVQSDTYMHDAPFLAAARTRLAQQGWTFGWGIHIDGDVAWDGRGDAFVVGTAYGQANLVPSRQAAFQDQAEFLDSWQVRETLHLLPFTVLWNMQTVNDGVLRELQKEGRESAPDDRDEPGADASLKACDPSGLEPATSRGHAVTPQSPESTPESKDEWLSGTQTIDLFEDELQKRTRALTQMMTGKRQMALAIYAFVKAVPYAMSFKVKPRTPDQILGTGQADAVDKATLMVAMLRVAGIPARLRAMRLTESVMRGMVVMSPPGPSARAVVQAWLGGRWVQTDTFIYDAALASAMRARLRARGWKEGYCVGLNGHSTWDGVHDAFLLGEDYAKQHLAPEDETGIFAGPDEFRDGEFVLSLRSVMKSQVHMNSHVRSINKLVRQLRNEHVADPSTDGLRPRQA